MKSSAALTNGAEVARVVVVPGMDSSAASLKGTEVAEVVVVGAETLAGLRPGMKSAATEATVVAA